MVTLVFLLVVAAVFGSVLALEGGGDPLRRGPLGLLSWMTRGNWPAKVGGGLMIIGIGALLRYAALNLDLPPDLKLGTGIGGAALLALASSMSTRRRAVSLALGGSAFGVAYLTAYSAFALFGYLPTLPGLGLLALTAVGAGLFAVTRSAVSLAVLSMVGAFMAPAFAPEDPGPQVVYGYYVAISLLTLCMVAVRGWRPLIHLSFLFTLAGGAFFAWTADYFSAQHAPRMLPLVAMLVAVHVAMPLFERRWQRGVVVARLDTFYLFALPVASALTVLAMAPTRLAFAVELWWFAATWLLAAAWLFTQKREGSATHAIIGLLMLGLGLAVRFRDLPWELLALAISVCALSLAARRRENLVGFLAGLVLVLAAMHILGALGPSRTDVMFFNGRFFERFVGAALLLVAGVTLRRMRHVLDGLMLTVALGWLTFTMGSEIARLELVSTWLLLNWVLALVAFALFFVTRFKVAVERASVLVVALGVSVVLAQVQTHGSLAWISAIVSAAAMLAIALRPVAEADYGESSRLLAAIGVPVTVLLWMSSYSRGLAATEWQFPLAFTAAAGFILLVAGMRATQRSANWLGAAMDSYSVGFTLLVAASTLLDIHRSPAAVSLEIVSLGALFLIARTSRQRQAGRSWLVPALVVGVALVFQANLLRWLGPAGHLNVLSVAQMDWPTLVSLLWACMGAGLTLNARRVGSRVQWSAGAAFLVGAAIKLVLLDFGSLGQLANILAVIAAGGVFLLVGWLAPMPPPADAVREEAVPHPQVSR